jgi:hypothetical protein
MKHPAALLCFAPSVPEYEQAYNAKAVHFRLLTSGFNYSDMVL